jgi:hypothetical protein
MMDANLIQILGILISTLIVMLGGIVGWNGIQLHKRLDKVVEALSEIKVAAHDDIIELRTDFSLTRMEFKQLERKVDDHISDHDKK